MNIYLAATLPEINAIQDVSDINILETFFTLKKNDKAMKKFKNCHSFFLDSGAFTFLNSKISNINWDEYIDDYAAFINKWDIQLFFELDIDCIVGLQEVERLRAKLEALTGKKSIPVWHKNRGKDYFIKMCEVYPYVALGGIAIKEIPKKKYESVFPWFINIAHEHEAKIHGLGYTSISNLKKYHFDSVDSSTWKGGNKFGLIYKFIDGEIKTISKKGYRLDSKKATIYNLNEWIKYQKYAKNNL